jgi:site-specific DNA-methyltransferase (adenine-specific)
MTVRILQGDCIDRLKDLEDKSIHTCITSPPYWGLRNYNDEENQLGLENTPNEFVDNLVKVFAQVKRVLRDDGTLWLNLGDSYGRQTGSGFNANAEEGYSVSRRKELQEKQGNIKLKTNLPKKNLLGIPWRVALALQADGWVLRQDIIWHKPNPMPESTTDRCTKSHEYIFLLSKKSKYYYDHDAIKEDCVGKDERKWSDSYDKVGSIIQGDSNAGIKRTKRYAQDGSFKRNKRSVWTVISKPYKGAHFATFPYDLIVPCVLAGCPEGGTVLDPFGGTGTTGIVANNNNRDAILVELNQEYVDLAKDRLRKDCGMFLDLEIS